MNAEDFTQVPFDVIHQVAGMGWQMAWALVLGLVLSAVVRAWVPRERVQARLGQPGLRALLEASAWGAASSSCSYAAAAMSRTLFAKGADAGNASAFLIASTNLVLEIGLVIWLLLGWPFLAAELVGGVVMIVLVAMMLRWCLPATAIAAVRERVRAAQGDSGAGHGAERAAASPSPFSRAGIDEVARGFSDELGMIGRDIGLGLFIAGTLAALVPADWWASLFLAPGATNAPGAWVSLENVVVGPLVAMLACVCSVGNIPLAAVLWHSGISFGGVVAFILADLVTVPMLRVYRRYYGTTAALAYGACLLLAMVLTGLAIDGVFRHAGLVPAVRAGVARPADYFAWDYTTMLDCALLPAAAWLLWRARAARG